MKCERCERNIKGQYYKILFIHKGKPLYKKCCKKCADEIRRKLGVEECQMNRLYNEGF